MSLKKTFLHSLLSLSILVSACGGERTPEETEESSSLFTYTYKTAEFQMDVPSEWELVDEFTSEYPDELEVAFRNDIKDGIFTANVSVLKEENEADDLSYDFAQKKLADHEDTLLNYKLLSQEIVTLKVGGADSKTVLSVFEGKNETSGPTLNFMQVSLTKGENAFTVTASYRSSEDKSIVQTMESMLRSFTLQ